jgi:hypothetical protein
VTDILERSSAIQWRHVPGKLSLADDGSRGVSAGFFTTLHRWFRDPDFLLIEPEAWPSPTNIAEFSNKDPEVSPAKWIGSVRVPIPHLLFCVNSQVIRSEPPQTSRSFAATLFT